MRAIAVVALLWSLQGDRVSLDAKRVSGRLRSAKDWQFLEKFCFDNTGSGEAHIDLKSNRPVRNTSGMISKTYILLYNDGENSWQTVHDSEKPCPLRVEEVEAKHMAELPPGELRRFLYKVEKAVRQRFWYIVITKCGDEIDIDYTIEFVNGGGSWYEQFSYDEQGRIFIYLFFTVIALLGSIGVTILVAKLWGRRLFSMVMKMFVCGYGLLTFSCIFHLTHLAQYKDDGVGVPGCEKFGQALFVIQSLIFMLGLLLISKGFTITTMRVDKKYVLCVMYGLLIALYAGSFIWDAARDKATTLYMYSSIPGYFLCFAHIAIMVYFLVELCKVHAFERRSKPKRRFYRVVGWCFSVWFLSLPLTVLFAEAMDPWERSKTVTTVSLLCAFLGYIIMPFLGRPSSAFEIYGGEVGSDKVPTKKQMGRIQPQLAQGAIAQQYITEAAMAPVEDDDAIELHM